MTTPPTSETTAAETRAALAAAWLAGTGRFEVPESVLDPKSDGLVPGWLTTDLVDAVTEMARWTVDQPLPVPGERYLASSLVSEVARRLLQMVVEMRPGIAFPLAEALAWAQMAAGAPGTSTTCWWEVRLGLGVSEAFEWRTAGLPSGLAALAYAAGLSVGEARVQHQAGMLNAKTLTVLAGFQGFRLR